MLQKYRTDVVLVAFFGFSFLKVNDTKDRIVNRHIRIQHTQIMCEQAEKIICTQMSSNVQCFIFQPRLNKHI